MVMIVMMVVMLISWLSAMAVANLANRANDAGGPVGAQRTTQGGKVRATQGIKLLPKAFKRLVFAYRASFWQKRSSPNDFTLGLLLRSLISTHKTWDC